MTRLEPNDQSTKKNPKDKAQPNRYTCTSPIASKIGKARTRPQVPLMPEKFDSNPNTAYIVKRLPADTRVSYTTRYGIQRREETGGQLLIVSLEPRFRLVNIGLDMREILRWRRPEEPDLLGNGSRATLQEWVEPILAPLLLSSTLPIAGVRRFERAEQDNRKEIPTADLSVPVMTSADWMDRARSRPEEMLDITDINERSLIGFLAATFMKPDTPIKNPTASGPWHILVAALLIRVGGAYSTKESLELLEVVPGFPQASTIRSVLERKLLVDGILLGEETPEHEDLKTNRKM
jgi:hypothetical protein